ncbi:hypothetical protein [Chromobacterium violaceum]|uniref:hypothetical protein n=1 Tax=Chromobacterium violaceum TaxID=536 RepID=UPI0005B96B3E|nr:hypothetical protein [Chromobacterium violaceum]
MEEDLLTGLAVYWKGEGRVPRGDGMSAVAKRGATRRIMDIVLDFAWALRDSGRLRRLSVGGCSDFAISSCLFPCSLQGSSRGLESGERHGI